MTIMRVQVSPAAGKKERSDARRSTKVWERGSDPETIQKKRRKKKLDSKKEVLGKRGSGRKWKTGECGVERKGREIGKDQEKWKKNEEKGEDLEEKNERTWEIPERVSRKKRTIGEKVEKEKERRMDLVRIGRRKSGSR